MGRFATPALLLIQGWSTFYSAYEDGLEAQRRGDPAAALRAYAFAVTRRPEPGVRIKTYGLNFLPEYFPYLRTAECALALGDLDRAERALRDSERWAKEPSAQREALAQRLRQARAAQKPKEPPAPQPAPSQPVQSQPAPVQAQPPPASVPSRAEPAPAPAEPAKAQLPSLPGPRPKGEIQPTKALPEPALPTPQRSDPTQPLPSTPASRAATPSPQPAPSPAPTSFPLRGIGLGLGLALAGGLAGWLLRRARRRRLSPGSNPYKVDLGGRGKNAPTLLSPGRATGPGAMPQRVGPYVIRQVLGRGGCAVTYLAEHEEEGREVALKIPHAHIVLDPDFLARFHREAALGAQLRHPGIVKVLDPGPEEGEPWMAMEFVRGTTLEDHLRLHPRLPLNETLHLGWELASALAYAHAKGVVHRDLKPANIMLGEEGARIMDFGIARLTDSVVQTSTGVFIGTPAYSAPEGLVNPRVGPPADRYALGIILFELLTGRPPFQADTSYALLQLHQRAPLPDLRVLCPDAPARLVRLVERLCQKRPDERPEDPEVLEVLRELKESHPL